MNKPVPYGPPQPHYPPPPPPYYAPPPVSSYGAPPPHHASSYGPPPPPHYSTSAPPSYGAPQAPPVATTHYGQPHVGISHGHGHGFPQQPASISDQQLLAEIYNLLSDLNYYKKSHDGGHHVHEKDPPHHGKHRHRHDDPHGGGYHRDEPYLHDHPHHPVGEPFIVHEHHHHHPPPKPSITFHNDYHDYYEDDYHDLHLHTTPSTTIVYHSTTTPLSHTYNYRSTTAAPTRRPRQSKSTKSPSGFHARHLDFIESVTVPQPRRPGDDDREFLPVRWGPENPQRLRVGELDNVAKASDWDVKDFTEWGRRIKPRRRRVWTE